MFVGGRDKPGHDVFKNRIMKIGVDPRSVRIAALFGALAVLAPAAAAASDPYAPLKLYEGRWTLTFSSGEKLFVTNHCARLAKAYACEQVVEGSASDLVVFVPVDGPAGADTYKTIALAYASQTPGPWTRLIIEGSHWSFESTAIEDGKTVYHRTINDFDGANHIRFAQQRSADAKTWETISEGEEVRIR